MSAVSPAQVRIQSQHQESMHAAHVSSLLGDEVCYRWSGFHDVGHVPQLARMYDGTARGLRKLPPIKGTQAQP